MATSDNGSAFLTKFEEREGEGLCLNIWLMFKASLYVEITANLILLDMLYCNSKDSRKTGMHENMLCISSISLELIATIS